MTANHDSITGESLQQPKSNFHALVLGAMGVVFGDIGTSPLYAIRESFHGEHAFVANEVNIMGALSMIFWSLMLIIGLKYVVLILRADNKGEGGILALETLARKDGGLKSRRMVKTIMLLGIFGSTLLYGDGIITPAISVLSALEGLRVATPIFDPFVPLLTVIVLSILFSVQKQGTAKIGAIFGPITILWFLAIGILGFIQITKDPQVLLAVNPAYAWNFFMANGIAGYVILGTVFLTVTGGEALYADMGHFGRTPIQIGWFTVVLPCLLLNYFGQGSLILNDPTAVENPFYRLVPSFALYPMVILATLATVIASQALISGVFSLTRQAIQLGYCPRMAIKHTSQKEIGQIYVPFVNWSLLIGSVWLVLEFQSSSSMAAAYGIAVSLTMLVTTFLAFVVAIRAWKWRPLIVLLVFGPFLIIDLAFLGSNALKVLSGGWIPILLALFIYVLSLTWIKGRQLLARELAEHSQPFSKLLEELQSKFYGRVKGTAIYMSGRQDTVPLPLSHNMRHNKVIHERVVLVTFITKEIPHVPPALRLSIEQLSEGLFRIVVSLGFMDAPDLNTVLALAAEKNLLIDPEEATFFLGREIILATSKKGMAEWREKVFAFLGRNAQSPVNYFNLPAKQVMEVGVQVEI